MHWENAKLIIEFYFGPAFYYGGFLLIPALCFGSRNRSILFLLTFYYCCTRVIPDIIPHYTAPATALIYLAATATLRSCWSFAPHRLPTGKALVHRGIGPFPGIYNRLIG